MTDVHFPSTWCFVSWHIHVSHLFIYIYFIRIDISTCHASTNKTRRSELRLNRPRYKTERRLAVINSFLYKGGLSWTERIKCAGGRGWRRYISSSGYDFGKGSGARHAKWLSYAENTIRLFWVIKQSNNKNARYNILTFLFFLFSLKSSQTASTILGDSLFENYKLSA